ncbi:MAG: rRNA adenine N-6-methyltransferase family protein [Gammaproteobacteria bacterium]
MENLDRKFWFSTQIEPLNTQLSKEIQRALLQTSRQLFVPSEYKNLVYTDENLWISQYQHVLFSAFILEKLLVHIQPNPQHFVLEIGTGLGYFSCILAQLTHRVLSLDSSLENIKHATQKALHLNLRNLHCLEIKNFLNPYHLYNHRPSAGFNTIVITGQLPYLPSFLLELLGYNGQIIYILPFKTFSQVLKYEYDYQQQTWKQNFLFYADFPVLARSKESRHVEFLL